jgi:RNA polymerase sigma-70 factor (ECF subfamily)
VTRALVEAAQRADHGAFEALVIARVDRLFGVARLILHDVHLAEDAVQEALIKAWRELPNRRDADRLDAWHHRLLVNACADQGRSRRRTSNEVALVRVHPSGDDTTGATADRDQIERGFRRLGPDQRAAVVLRYHAGFSAEEIAVILGRISTWFEPAASRSSLDGPSSDIAHRPPSPRLVWPRYQ